MLEQSWLVQFLEAVLLVSGKPLTESQMVALLDEADRPSLNEIRVGENYEGLRHDQVRPNTDTSADVRR